MYILSVALFALDYSVSVTPNQGMVGDIFKYELIVTYTESESLISVPDTSLFQAFSIQKENTSGFLSQNVREFFQAAMLPKALILPAFVVFAVIVIPTVEIRKNQRKSPISK